MEPTLEDAVREFARVRSRTRTLAKLGTRRAAIVKPPGIATPRLLPGVRERTLGPIVRARPRTPTHFELVHSEIVRETHLRVRFLRRGRAAPAARYASAAAAVSASASASASAAAFRPTVHVRSFVWGRRPRRAPGGSVGGGAGENVGWGATPRVQRGAIGAEEEQKFDRLGRERGTPRRGAVHRRAPLVVLGTRGHVGAHAEEVPEHVHRTVRRRNHERRAAFALQVLRRAASLGDVPDA